MSHQIIGGKGSQEYKAIDQYTGTTQPKSPNSRPIKSHQTNNSDSEYDSEGSSEENSPPPHKFVEIRAVDVNTEVMELQGELKIAYLEIKRLRK